MRLPPSEMPGVLIDPGKAYVHFIIALSTSNLSDEQLAKCSRQVLLSMVTAAAPDDRPDDPEMFVAQIIAYAASLDMDDFRP